MADTGTSRSNPIHSNVVLQLCDSVQIRLRDLARQTGSSSFLIGNHIYVVVPRVGGRLHWQVNVPHQTCLEPMDVPEYQLVLLGCIDASMIPPTVVALVDAFAEAQAQSERLSGTRFVKKRGGCMLLI